MQRSTGRLERLAYERAQRDAQDGSVRSIRFDADSADHAIQFFEHFLHHSKGEWSGQQFILAEWQRWLIGQLFGWKREDGSRRFRIAYIQLARKNGKSTLAAGIALYCLIADKEPVAEVYSVATMRDQARIVFDEACRMIEKSVDLSAVADVYRHAINVPSINGIMKPLSSDSQTLDGLSVHCTIIDELHAHKDGRVWDVIETATGSRRQSLIAATTTAGAGQAGVCWDQRKHAVGILEGNIEDDGFFAFITEPDDGDDWRSPEYLEKANPNIGVTVQADILAEKCRRAQESPRLQNAFRRLHGNEWTEQVERWLDLTVWDECAGDLDRNELADSLVDRPCWVGVDLSQSTDLTAAVAAFPLENGDVAIIGRYWLPEDRMQKRVDSDRVPYDRWAAGGSICLTHGDVIDHQFIRDAVCEWAETYQVKEVNFDPFLAMQFSIMLNEEGLETTAHRQGFISMNEPTRTFERLVLGRKIIHGGDPVMRWMIGNAAVSENSAGLIKPDKKASSERIDGAVAAIMAVGRSMVQPAAKPSVYESRGIRTL